MSKKGEANTKKESKRLIIIGIVVAALLLFYLAANVIVVIECGTTACDCREYDCSLMGCGRITLWDEISCNFKMLFDN